MKNINLLSPLPPPPKCHFEGLSTPLKHKLVNIVKDTSFYSVDIDGLS